jgi:hypothetical protein
MQVTEAEACHPRNRSERAFLNGVASIAHFFRQLACLRNPDPVDMKVYAPAGEETFDDIRTTEEAQAGADRRETA